MAQQGLKQTIFCLAVIVYPKYMVRIVLYQRYPNWIDVNYVPGVREHLSRANRVRVLHQRRILQGLHPFETLEFTKNDNGIFRDLSKSLRPRIIVGHCARICGDGAPDMPISEL